MAQDRALDEMMQFKRLDDLRVLLALIQQLDYENLIVANQADISKKLGMRPSNVSSAIRRLVEAGAIIRGPKVGINCSYKLNPEFGWKGSTKNHIKALDQYRKEKMKAALSTEAVQGKEVEGEPTEDSE
jgi:DNA-binding Lrp family transcriptional regulator